MSRNTLLSTQILDSLDISSKEDCLAAQSKLIYQHGINQKRYERAHTEAEGLLNEFSGTLKAGEKSLEVIKKCHEKITNSGNVLATTIDDISQLYDIMEGEQHIDGKTEENIQKQESFNKIIKEFDKKFTTDSTALRQLIDEIENRFQKSRLADVANRTMLPDDAPERGRRIFKEYPSFQPDFKVSPNTSRLDYKRWRDTQEIFFKVCNADILGAPEQQALFYQKVENSLKDLVKDDTTDQTRIWPLEHNPDGTSVIECMDKIIESNNPKTLDRGKFFAKVQSDKQSDHKYIASMKQMYHQFEVDKMTTQELLAHICFKGLRDQDLKKEIVENVKGVEKDITVAAIEKAVTIKNAQRQLGKCGAPTPTVNQSQPNTSGTNNNNSSSGFKGKGKGKGKGKSNFSQSNAAGSGGKGNQSQNKSNPDFVDFSKLQGQAKLTAMKTRGYCLTCGKKHDKGNCKFPEDYKCKYCQKKHYSYVCAFKEQSEKKTD